MGTNFYLAAPHLSEFYDEEDSRGLHIGKSSIGWGFSWRGHPGLGVRSRDDWEELFANCGDAAILDEYGSMVTFAEFKRRAFKETRDPDGVLNYELHGGFLDVRGERFYDGEFC